jgi:anthranilate synthase component 1
LTSQATWIRRYPHSLKLARSSRAILLESVEGGVRLARYSFIGFGEGLEVRLDSEALTIGSNTFAVPASPEELLNAPAPDAVDGAAAAARVCPTCRSAVAWWDSAAYDVVRFSRSCPARLPHPSIRRCRILHYVAPQSLLVFDHLTRGIALLHAGSEAERQALRREVIAALRGAMPCCRCTQGSFSDPDESLSREQFLQAASPPKEYIAAGDVYQLVLSVRSPAARSRSVPGVSRAAAAQSVALHVLLRSSAT